MSYSGFQHLKGQARGQDANSNLRFHGTKKQLSPVSVIRKGSVVEALRLQEIKAVRGKRSTRQLYVPVGARPTLARNYHKQIKRISPHNYSIQGYS